MFTKVNGVSTLTRFSLAGLLILSFVLSSSMSASAQSSDPGAGAEAKPLAQPTNNLVVSKRVSLAEQNNALAFWTRDTIAAAQPLVMPTDAGSAIAEPAAFESQSVSGPAGFSAPGTAEADAVKVAMAAYASDWAAPVEAASDQIAAADVPAGTSQAYTSYDVNRYTGLWKIYPLIWIGRLSFQTSGGTSYCSATAISGNNFVTAAHCVYDSTNNRWHSGWAFSPAYRNGTTPYGTFAATVCTILTDWINLSGNFSINGWTKYDVAVCSVGKNSAGQTLNGAVGFAGREWNFGYVRNHHDLGYPFRDYNLTALTDAGLYLRLCTAESFQQTTDTLGMGCNWGPGISGGPWMTGFAPNVVSGRVNSVNSGLFQGIANLYGIRFTSSNIVPICTVRAC